MLGGIGLLLMQRLPQDLVVQQFGDAELGLGQLQLGWLLLALAVIAVLALVVRSDAWLRTYKYTWAAAGIALLLLTFVFGSDVNGARLTLSIGPLSGQPSELLKVILVVFLAAYLSENRSAARRREHADRPHPPAADPVPRPDGRDVGDRPRDRRRAAGPRRGAPVLRGLPRDALRGDRPAVVRRRRRDPVHRRLVGPVQPVRPRAAAGRQLDRPLPRPAGRRLPDRPGAVRLRARRRARGGPGRRAADDRRAAAGPGGAHGLPARGAGRGAGPDRPARDPRPVSRGGRARAADRRRGARRVPGPARRGPRAGRGRPGVHHRRGQPQAHPADRDHAAADLVRRLVAAGERAGDRAAAGPVGPGRRAAGASRGQAADGWPRCCAGTRRRA